MSSWATFAWSLHLSQLKENFAQGIEAAVELYYEDYSDADCLDPATYQALKTLIETVTLNEIDDLDELIKGVEQRIHENSGRRFISLDET